MRGLDTQQIDGVVNLIINSLNSAGVSRFQLTVTNGTGKFTATLNNGDWYEKIYATRELNENTTNG